MSIKLDLSALNAQIGAMQEDVMNAVRPSAQAGAEVLYQQVLRNVDSIGTKSGNLRKSIYQAYSKANSGKGFATYHVSWNPRRAPHGHLLEFGHIQRYQTVIAKWGPKKGQWITLVRPEMKGKKPPNRRKASRAQMDAYWMPRKGGPVQVPARAFIRRGASSIPAALAAMEAKFFELMGNDL